MKPTLLSILFSVFALSASSASAEVKPYGTVLQYACAQNANTESALHNFCFAQIVGEQGQYVTTEIANGKTIVWKVAELIQPSQIGKDGQIFQRLQLQQVGLLIDNLMHPTINAQVLAGQILKSMDSQSQIIAVDGEISGEVITARQFQNYEFTMDEGAQSL